MRNVLDSLAPQPDHLPPFLVDKLKLQRDIAERTYDLLIDPASGFSRPATRRRNELN